MKNKFKKYMEELDNKSNKKAFIVFYAEKDGGFPEWFEEDMELTYAGIKFNPGLNSKNNKISYKSLKTHTPVEIKNFFKDYLESWIDLNQSGAVEIEGMSSISIIME